MLFLQGKTAWTIDANGSSYDISVCRNGDNSSCDCSENLLNGILVELMHFFIQPLLDFTFQKLCGFRGYLLCRHVHQKSCCILHNRVLVNHCIYTILYLVEKVVKEWVGHGQGIGAVLVKLALSVMFLTDSLLLLRIVVYSWRIVFKVIHFTVKHLIWLSPEGLRGHNQDETGNYG